MRASIQRTVTSVITSARLRQWQRQWKAFQRSVTGASAQVHYFHQTDDPYSHLASSQLAALEQRYAITLVRHDVPAPEASAAPEPKLLSEWSIRDAQRLAHHFGIDFRASQTAENSYTEEQRMAGQKLRKKWGHYLGATFYFEGEWYWGLDRLHHLEHRLMESGLAKAPLPLQVLFPPRPFQMVAPVPVGKHRPVIHFYCSLRSPYTYLAAQQVRLLAEHYGADLKLRFVLPMVMRGLPVPLAKRLYILRDAKREAERLGLNFGRIVDPVGSPTERGLALLHHAIALGMGSALLESFLQGVFTDGLDAGSDRGLLHIAQRAGLTPADVQHALSDKRWRIEAERNRSDMLARGIWGVPSFRVNEQAVLWGQDRLWMLEEDLISELNS